MSQNTKSVNIIVKLQNVRLSFPQLFEAKAGDEPGSKPKFGATFLLHKVKNVADINRLQAAVATVKTTSDVLKGKKIAKQPIREGSEKDQLDGYSDDVMFISARNHNRPGVVNRDLTPLVAADGKPYAGCYVNATVECYGYTHPKSGPGITWSLRNVQFVKDGEPFGAKTAPAEQDFAALPDEDDSVV
jgi:hypothetical protein